MRADRLPSLLILNQMAGPMTRELVEDLADEFGCVELLTGHPDTLVELCHPGVRVTPAVRYVRGLLPRRLVTWIRYVLHAWYWVWSRPRTIPLLVFSNPPILVWLAALTRRLRGTSFAVIVHDIYPDVAIRQRVLSEGNPVTWCWRWLNRRSYEQAEVVMTLGTYMAQTLNQQFDAGKTRAGEIIVVPPWADRRRFLPIAKSDNPFAIAHHLVERFIVAYSGNMGWGHDLESVLQAARGLRDHHECLHFLLIGEGPKWAWLHDELKRHPEDHVTLLPWVNEANLPYSLATADLAVVSLEAELSQLAVPSKAYYFLATGVPLIAICEPHTELAQLVEKFHCGIVIPPGRPDLLQQVIQGALHSPSQMQLWRQGAAHAAEESDRRRQVESLIMTLGRSLMSSNHPSVEQLQS